MFIKLRKSLVSVELLSPIEVLAHDKTRRVMPVPTRRQMVDQRPAQRSIPRRPGEIIGNLSKDSAQDVASVRLNRQQVKLGEKAHQVGLGTQELFQLRIQKPRTAGPGYEFEFREVAWERTSER